MVHILSSVQRHSSVSLFATPWTATFKSSLSISNTQSLLKFISDTIQLPHPFPPAFNLPQHQRLFQWVISSHQVDIVLELQFQHQSFQWIFRIAFLYNWLVRYSCCPKDSQESSPTPHFKSINSSVSSFLYDPALTSIHDYWKNHSLDYTELSW